MNPTLIKAVIVVTFALVFYSIGIITEQRKHSISSFVLVFMTLGIIFDISSTALMIIGSNNIPITAHGMLGYSALTVMLIDTILIWKSWSGNRKGNGKPEVSRKLHIYTRSAYIWWVIAYIAGAIISTML